MLDKLLAKLIDLIFPHNKNFNEDELVFWDKHWNEMIEYYKKYGEIFEIRDEWDFHCN